MKYPSTERLKNLVNYFPGKRVLIIGDIMLDHYVRGHVTRISPEAPVPVVRVKHENYLAGGAGNVANNLASLDSHVSLISIAGTDKKGELLLELISNNGIDVSGVIKDKSRQTTEKIRIIAEHQQVVRVDRENDTPPSADTLAECAENIKTRIGESRCVILSDYAKGMFANAELIRMIIAECSRKKVPVCVDPKIEHFRKFKKATCITPNTNEAWLGMGMHPKEGQDQIELLGRKILKTLSCASVLITQGEQGMTVLEGPADNADILHIPTKAKEVYDVTGAGDTVISVMALAIASGAKIHEAAVLSNFAAGVVIGKLGTAVLTRKELLESI